MILYSTKNASLLSMDQTQQKKEKEGERKTTPPSASLTHPPLHKGALRNFKTPLLGGSLGDFKKVASRHWGGVAVTSNLSLPCARGGGLCVAKLGRVVIARERRQSPRRRCRHPPLHKRGLRSKSLVRVAI